MALYWDTGTVYWDLVWPYGQTGEYSFFAWRMPNTTTSNPWTLSNSSRDALNDGTNVILLPIRPSDLNVGTYLIFPGDRPYTAIGGTYALQVKQWLPEISGYKISNSAANTPKTVWAYIPRSGIAHKSGGGTHAYNGLPDTWDVMTVGRNGWGTNYRQFYGALGPHGIWNRRLTEGECIHLSSGGNFRDVPGLIHMWDFTQEGDQPDRVGNLNLIWRGSTTPSIVAGPPIRGLNNTRLSTRIPMMSYLPSAGGRITVTGGLRVFGSLTISN